MDDGGLGTFDNLILYTNSYTSGAKREVDLLVKVLKIKFNLESRKTLKTWSMVNLYS